MRNERKEEDVKELLRKKINRQNINRSYVILYSVLILIILVGELYLARYDGFSAIELFRDILGNLLGVMAAFLFFDVFHEKISKDSYAEEMSEKILDTLMANPEAMELFTEDQRKKFISATVKSFTQDEDAIEMIGYNVMEYLGKPFRLRTRFDYKFEIQDRLPVVYEVLPKFQEYFYVQEILGYDIKYMDQSNNNLNSSRVTIAFTFDNKSLDCALREKEIFEKCIFRENLDLTIEDQEFIKRYPKAKLKDLYLELFKVDLQIDRCEVVLKEVEIVDKAIFANYEVMRVKATNEHSVRIIFHMPKRWGSVLEIAFVDPTKAPKITLSYPEDSVEVDMLSFLSKGEETSYETAHEHHNGIYDIAINSEWIYPISGVVFKVSKKKEIITKKRSIEVGDKMIRKCEEGHYFLEEKCPYCGKEVKECYEERDGDCIACGQLCPDGGYMCSEPYPINTR